MRGASSWFACVGAAVLLAASAAVGQSCSVQYNRSGKPLLFGGVATECQYGCKARDDYWGQVCSFQKESDPKLVCSPQAYQSTLGTLNEAAAWY